MSRFVELLEKRRTLEANVFDEFIEFAKANENLTFLVTEIGCISWIEPKRSRISQQKQKMES
jgi:hypothetical protein